MLGPLFVPELLRLTRSPWAWAWALRVGYGLAALLIVTATFGGAPPRSYVLLTPWALIFATAVLTPLAAAGAGLPARDRAALDALRSAAGDADLVRGLVAARAALFGSAALLAPLPRLAFIDESASVAAAVSAFQAALALAFAATTVRAGLGLDPWKDVVGTSAAGLGIALHFAAISAMHSYRAPIDGVLWAEAGAFAAAGLVAAGAYAGLAARGLRRHDPDPAPPPRTYLPPPLPPLAGDPILWRERSRSPPSAAGGVAVVFPAFVLGAAQPAGYSTAVSAAGGLLLAAVAAAAGRRAAESVADDRERGTLEVLLTTPAGRAGVLAAKGRASLESAILLVLACCLAVALGFATSLAAVRGTVRLPSPAWAVQLPAALAAWSLLAASAGLWLSVVFARRRSATLAFGVGLAALTVAGLAACRWVPPPGWPGQHPVAAAGGLAMMSVAAWLLWRDAVRRFDRDPLRLG